VKDYIHFDKNWGWALCLPRRKGAHMSRTSDATKYWASFTLFTTNSLSIFSLGVMLFSLYILTFCTSLAFHVKRKLIHYLNKKLWEEPIAYYPFMQYGPHTKQFLVAAGTTFPSCYLATQTHRYTHLTILSCRRNSFTQPLPMNERRDALY
jgi:hypothetical protein